MATGYVQSVRSIRAGPVPFKEEGTRTAKVAKKDAKNAKRDGVRPQKRRDAEGDAERLGKVPPALGGFRGAVPSSLAQNNT